MDNQLLLKKLNEQQFEAVTHGDAPLLIIAGAGTGKTTVITQRVVWLIEQKKAKSDEILALTFTDKAAGEMEERVDKLLPYGYVDLWIMTFHAFCERLLKQHGLDIGIPNDFKLLNQTEQWLLVRQNLDKFNLDYYQPLGNPTKFIHALIKHFSRCKDEEIGPEDYLEYAEKLKINQDSMEATGGRPPAFAPSSLKDIQPYWTTAGRLSNGKNKEPARHSSEPVKSDGEQARLEEVANAYHIYQQLLLDNESLDFGDLINYTLKLFRTRPNILKKYQEQFKYILVDEFQDTNWAQYELVKLLATPRNNITVVSDDDQAIYRWRGASYNNAIQFKKDYPNAKEISLIKNYRSSQNILDMAYKFIQLNNPERLEAQFGSDKLSKKLKSKISGLGIIEHLHASDESEEVKMVIDKILELYNQSTRSASSGQAINNQQLTNNSNKNNNKITRLQDNKISWNDFVILVRANNQAEAFLNGLRQAEIPFNFVASKGLYSKEVIMDILSYLKLLDNYHESMALWHILNLPIINIKVEDLMTITRLAHRKTLSLFEAISQINTLANIEDETKRKINKILNLLAQHTKLAQEKSVKQVVLAFLNDYGYNGYLLNKNDTQAFIYINQLGRKIDDFEKSFDDKSVKNFMNIIALELESGEQGDLSRELEEGPEAVKVMTIHSAKGLEFKYVFIVNLVDKRFPCLDRKEPIELPDELVKEIIPGGDIHLQEERRLFYVAMTRAKHGLFVTSAEDYRGQRKKKQSRFLYEIGIIRPNEIKEGLIAESRGIPSYSGRGITRKYSRGINEKIRDGLAKTLPTSFSYSQFKSFETCPYQYYLQFVLRVPVVSKPTFSYGKTMHTALYKFFSLIKERGRVAQGALFPPAPRGVSPRDKNTRIQEYKNKNNLPSLEKLLELYHDSWIDDWYESKQQKEEYRKQGEKSLKTLYEQLKTKIPPVLSLEQSFNFKLNNYTIKGVIDRVDLSQNHSQNSHSQNSQIISTNSQKNSDSPQFVEIIDYKTGRSKTSKDIEKDQLLIYQMASQETLGWQVEKLTFYYLDGNVSVSFLGTEDEIRKQKGKIVEVINNIKKCDFSASPSEFKCKYCDFSSICSFREL